MNEYKHILFKLQNNFKDSNACVTFPVSLFFHGYVKYTIFKNKKSKINKAMFMHIRIITLNKLNNVHISHLKM